MSNVITDDLPGTTAVIGEQSSRIRIALSVGCIAFTIYYVLMATVLRDAVLQDPDTFLHISVGNWILQNGSFMTTDHFSHTAFGKPWLATDWISQIIFAVLHRVGQWTAITEIMALTIGLIAGILGFYLATKFRLSIALGLAAIIVFLISPHFLARPVIFSYVLLLVWILTILELEDRNRWTGLQPFILIPLMLFWANVHASFTLGLAILCIFAGNAIYEAYRRSDWQGIRRLLMLVIGSTVAALITPYGIASVLRTFRLMSIPALTWINEWQPPNFQADKAHLIFIIGFFGLLLFCGLRLRGPRLLTLLMVTVFALEYKRGLGVFTLIAPLLVVRPLSEMLTWMKAPSHRPDFVTRFAARRTGAIALGSASLTIITALTAWTVMPPVRPPNSVAPESALAAAENAGLKDNVLNSYGFGGYLIFKGVPPFVDGRVKLYGDDFLRRYFASMRLTKPGDVAEWLKQYNIRWALLVPNEPIAYMLKTEGWTEVYKDPNAIVLAKDLKSDSSKSR